MDVSELLRLKEERRKKRRAQFTSLLNPDKSTQNETKRIHVDSPCSEEDTAKDEDAHNAEVNFDSKPPSHDEDKDQTEFSKYPDWVHSALKEIENVKIKEEYIIEEPSDILDIEKEKKKTGFSLDMLKNAGDSTLEFDEDSFVDASKYLKQEIPKKKFEKIPENFFEEDGEDTLLYGVLLKNYLKPNKKAIDESLQDFEAALDDLHRKNEVEEENLIQEEDVANKEQLRKLKNFINKLRTRRVQNNKVIKEPFQLDDMSSDEDIRSGDISSVLDQVWRQRKVKEMFL